MSVKWCNKTSTGGSVFCPNHRVAKRINLSKSGEGLIWSDGSALLVLQVLHRFSFFISREVRYM